MSGLLSRTTSQLIDLKEMVSGRRARRRAILARGAERLEAGRSAEADAILSEGLSIFPGDAAMLRQLAFAAHNAGRWDTAAERWHLALRAAPHDPVLYCGLAASQREGEQYRKASATIEDALSIFPRDFGILTEAARIAAAINSYDEALRLWDRAHAIHGANADLLLGRCRCHLASGNPQAALLDYDELRSVYPHNAGLAPLAVRLAAWIEDRECRPPAVADIRTRETISPAHLVCEFESLGDNCEFGLFQRCCGVEPLSLLRFSACFNRHTLIRAIEERFEPMGHSSDVEVDLDPVGEYYCGSRHYKDFRRHTFVSSNEMSIEAVTVREVKRTVYLRDRLMSDLDSCERIFVRREREDTFGSPHDLLATIRQAGPNTLLWVKLAGEDHRPGELLDMGDGLLCGFVRQYADGHALDMLGWLDICRQALAMKRGNHHPGFKLPDNRILQAGRRLEPTGNHCACEPTKLTFQSFPAQKFRFSATAPEGRAVAALRVLEPVGSEDVMIAFSLWVMVPDQFAGSSIEVAFHASAAGAVAKADLGQRNEWQLIWAATRMPKDQSSPTALLIVDGRGGDVFYTSRWLLEEGCLPAPLAGCDAD